MTRERNWDRRPPIPSGRYVNAHSMDYHLDWTLSDGAKETCTLILNLAGGPDRELRTFTKSLASQRGITDRAIRYHYGEFEAAAWLDRRHDPQTNHLLLRVSPRLHARPGASAVPEDRKKRVPAPWQRPRQGRKRNSAIDHVPLYPPSGEGGGDSESGSEEDRDAAYRRREAERERRDREWSERTLEADKARWAPLISPGSEEALAAARERLGASKALKE